MEFEYSMPTKDDRARSKKSHACSNVRTELNINDKRRKRFIQSVESVSMKGHENQTADEFLEGLSKKQKRVYQKLNDEIHKIEKRGIERSHHQEVRARGEH
mmetsp:Transcript_62588/g.72801  ORF Transcript_62588/g.72801 Transcript_62588/m.72801 type:complete len:101 (+) Transcript_62588:24-326(+)